MSVDGFLACGLGVGTGKIGEPCLRGRNDRDYLGCAEAYTWRHGRPDLPGPPETPYPGTAASSGREG
jgi:hypothetical protein